LGRTKNSTKDREVHWGFYTEGRVSTNLVEDNLVEHFNKWSPYVRNFGLLMIELHTIPPSVTALIGKTAATAYDATSWFFQINISWKPRLA
jgi:hypothetical protein